MNIDELELVTRFGEEKPLSDEALAFAEASLRAAIEASSPPKPILVERRPRRTLAVAASAAGAAAIAVGSLAFIGGGTARPKSTHQATATHGGTTIDPAADAEVPARWL